jgi:hypothetical protein
MKNAIHKTKVLTPAERRRMKSLQAELDAEKDEIVAYAQVPVRSQPIN